MTKDEGSFQLENTVIKLGGASLGVKLTVKTVSISGLVGFEKTVRSRETLINAAVSTGGKNLRDESKQTPKARRLTWDKMWKMSIVMSLIES